MSSLVKLGIENFKQRYLQPDLLPSVVSSITKSKYGLQLGGGNAIYLGGKSNGEPVEGGLVKSGETVQIMFGTVFPSKDNMLMSFNAALAEFANVSCPTVLEPERQAVALTFQARKQIDLSKFEWLVRIYLLE